MKPYFEESGITIYHGDCREILPQLGSVDVVITDPPYGIEHASNHICETTTAEWMDLQIAGDASIELRDWIWAWAHATKTAIACFGTWKVPRPQFKKAVLIWDKGPAAGMGDLSFPWKNSFEEIYISGEGWCGSRDEGVIKGRWVVTRASMGRTHPNEKPDSLFLYLINKHEGQAICDPFLGSGGTLVAAKNLGRKAIGIEIEEKYCEIAVKRLAQGVLFPASACAQP